MLMITGMTDFELNLFASLLQLLPELLRDHPYSIYELAQESAKKLGQPVCEVMTPLAEALHEMCDEGVLCYNRSTKQVILS